MADANPFEDLIPQRTANPFADLIPAKASITDAVTDIPSEVGKAYSSAAQHLTGNSVDDLPGYDPRTRGQLGPIEGLMRTGKQVLGLPELLASLPTGLARSVVGHLMSQGEHAVGTVIAPEIAAKDNPQAMYETAKGDVDLAMSAARPGAVPGPTAQLVRTSQSQMGRAGIKAAPEAAANGQRVVYVDPAAIDAEWAKTPNFYIDRGAATSGSQQRYQRATDFLSKSDRFKAPEIQINDSGNVAFDDGRHRFAVMRDADVGPVPVSMTEQSIRNAADKGYLVRDLKPPPAPTVADLKTSASSNYESPAVLNLEVKPTSIKNFSGTAQLKLNNSGFDENLAPKTFGILSKLETVPDRATVTGQNFNTVRKMLRKATESADATERAAASIAIDHLDDFIPKIPQTDVIAGDVGQASKALETARGDYSAAKQAQNIDNKLISAELRAASTHSGSNVANTIRQRMAAIADPTKPKEGRGLLPQEIDQARTIAEGTPTQNALRKVGNVLGGGGGLGMLHGGSAGAALGAVVAGPAGAAVGATAVPALGHLLKALSNKMTIRQAEQLSEAIRSRAPLASSAAKFSMSAATVQKSRTPQAMVGAMLAARNLSNNLRSAGLNFSPADLLSGLQSPSSSDAQDQQPIPRPPGQ